MAISKEIREYLSKLGVKGRKSRWAKYTKEQRQEYMKDLALKRKKKLSPGTPLQT